MQAESVLDTQDALSFYDRHALQHAHGLVLARSAAPPPFLAALTRAFWYAVTKARPRSCHPSPGPARLSAQPSFTALSIWLSVVCSVALALNCVASPLSRTSFDHRNARRTVLVDSEHLVETRLPATGQANWQLSHAPEVLSRYKLPRTHRLPLGALCGSSLLRECRPADRTGTLHFSLQSGAWAWGAAPSLLPCCVLLTTE